MNISKKNKILLGVLGAAAIGAVVAMLVAPEKTKKLRKSMKDMAGDWSDKLKDLAASGKHELEGAKVKARSEMNHLKSKAEESLGRM
ncbi:YtxH domain-containing protein [Pollutibacter soli]|uniref:YtxH domain-containing protein n=1 Tax=Pollutibacter soli TaxID=3034157 RepID=UPI003013ED4F